MVIIGHTLVDHAVAVIEHTLVDHAVAVIEELFQERLHDRVLEVYWPVRVAVEAGSAQAGKT